MTIWWGKGGQTDSNAISAVSCFRSDGFPQPMWTRKECSKEWVFTDLAPFKSGTIFFLLFSEKFTHSFTHKTKKKKKVLVIFFWIPIFQRVFLPCFCIFNYASASLMFGFVLFNFLYRNDGKRQKKKKTWLAVCQHLCALQRLYWMEDTAETDCG